MEYPKRKNLRIPDFDYSENRAYFVTICTHERERSLSNLVPEHPGQPSLLPLGKMAEQCLLELPQRYPVEIDAYVIMPDHIHAIVVIESRRATARVAPTVGQVIGAYKSLVDHRWRSSHECGKLWQRGFYEHVIRNDADLSDTRRYIEGNPFRWLEKYR